MSVQVTVEFTDAQWALVQDHYSIFEINEVNQEERVSVTVDSLSRWLTKVVRIEIEDCVKRSAREEADKITEDCFNV